MKSLNCLLTALVIWACCLMSCKKNVVDPSVPLTATASKAEPSVSIPPVTIFAAGTHTFTDIHICYDDKIFLLEGGKLKRLINDQLVDVPLAASVYKNFNPKFLTIDKDFVFYLRGDTGIKIIKGNKEVGYYQVGLPPLENFTPNIFGNYEIAKDETDQSLVFGTVRFGFDSILYSLAKITKDGHYRDITFPNVEEQFITAFDLGPSTGVIWSGNLETTGSSYFGGLLKSSVTEPPAVYGQTFLYGLRPSTHISFPTEGPIETVEFGVLSGFTVSKDSKVVFFKTGHFGEIEDNGVGTFGDVYSIKDGQVKLLTKDIENRRLAVSNDGKTLYLAGKGLYKLPL